VMPYPRFPIPVKDSFTFIAAWARGNSIPGAYQ
jgi:hypothetical protein